MREAIEKFMTRVVKSKACWYWVGPKNRDGYGVLSLGKRGTGRRAHRYSWELFNGAIPVGMAILHRCDNTSCVNPKHLYAGTQTDNMRDMVSRGRMANVKGERNPRAKLTSFQVNEIRFFLNAAYAHKQLAKQYGVSKSTIDLISRGVTWKEKAIA